MGAAIRDQLGLVRVQELLTGGTLSVSRYVDGFSKEAGKKYFCLDSCPYNTSVWGSTLVPSSGFQ